MNTTQQSTHGIFQNAIESVLYETSKFPEKPTESDEILHNLTNVSNVVSIIESGGFEPPKPSTLKRVHTGLKDSPRISERISKMFRNRVALSDFGKLNERITPRSEMEKRPGNESRQTEYPVNNQPQIHSPIVSEIKSRIRYEFSNEESVEQNETPILRRFNKKTSGASILLCMESETKMELLHTVKEPSDWGSSSFSPCFSDSNDDEELPQKSSEHTDLDGPTLIHLPEYSHSKLSRAKLHRKFSEFYKWDYVVLRSIAPAISKIRHDVLSTATVETNQRREIVMSIYKKCDEGANKELMALCCAMFFLNDDVHYDELTSPEEYAAEKYIRRRKRDFSC